MIIKFPLLCITNGSKMAWLLRAQELLRKEYNIMGRWHREGIDLTLYQKLRAAVQVDFPHTSEKLNKDDWKRYQDDRFMKKQDIIGESLGNFRKQSFDSTTYSPNLDDDIMEWA